MFSRRIGSGQTGSTWTSDFFAERPSVAVVTLADIKSDTAAVEARLLTEYLGRVYK